jgi:dTDP-D-glucose 4,6-dehydratase
VTLDRDARVLVTGGAGFIGSGLVWRLALRTVFEGERPTAVMHLAAESHVDRSIGAPGHFVRTNVVGTYTPLAEALRHWKTFSADEAARFRFNQCSWEDLLTEAMAEVAARRA